MLSCCELHSLNPAMENHEVIQLGMILWRLPSPNRPLKQVQLNCLRPWVVEF